MLCAYNKDPGFSDHFSQFFETKVLCDKISNAKELYFKCIYSDKNIELFKSLLQTTDWNSKFKGNISANERCDNFGNKINAYHDIAFPISKSKTKNTQVKVPWITKGIRKSSETFEYLAFLNRTCNDEITRSHFKKYQTVYRKVIR